MASGDPALVAALDGGATHTRAVIADRFGQVLGTGRGGPANHLLTDLAVVQESLRQALAEALHAAGAPLEQVVAVCAGTAGVNYDGAGREPVEEILHASLPRAIAVVVGDVNIALEGALAGAPGVVVIAGTGSIAFGRDQAGRCARAGGWGPLYGNEGSADEVSRLALRAAARAADGRGPATALLPMLCRRLGITDFAESISRIYGGQMPLEEVAALAEVVTEAAQAGDTAATGILRRAGIELARCAIAVLRRLRLDGGVVSYQGSMFCAGPWLREPLERALRRGAPGACLQPPRLAPVGGACRLALRAAGISIDEAILENLAAATAPGSRRGPDRNHA